MSSSFDMREGYSMLSEASETDVSMLYFIDDESSRTSFTSRGCGALLVDMQPSVGMGPVFALSESNNNSSINVFDFYRGNMMLSLEMESSSAEASSPPLPIPVWEGSLHRPLSFLHFYVPKKDWDASTAIENISQFLQAESDRISSFFDSATQKWQCGLLEDGVETLKFEISLLYDSKKDEIIVDWNRTRGCNSALFAKYFNKNRVSFRASFESKFVTNTLKLKSFAKNTDGASCFTLDSQKFSITSL